MSERTWNRNILRPTLIVVSTGLAATALSACSESSEKKAKPVDPDSFQCTESNIDTSGTTPVVTFATENGQAESAKVYIATQVVQEVGPKALADNKFRAGVLTETANTVTVTVMSGNEAANCPSIRP
jgi:hypothetical protein